MIAVKALYVIETTGRLLTRKHFMLYRQSNAMLLLLPALLELGNRKNEHVCVDLLQQGQGSAQIKTQCSNAYYTQGKHMRKNRIKASSLNTLSGKPFSNNVDQKLVELWCEYKLSSRMLLRHINVTGAT